jgi:glycosyltransferase involved in cell wall biosynthesis
MKKIKILVDAHWFDEFYSGVTTYIKGLYNELIKYDNLEIYLAARNLEKLKLDFPSESFKFIQLKNSSKYKRLLFEYPKIIKQYKIDFAHFQYVSPIFKSCKYIVTICDLLFIDFPQYFPVKYRLEKTFLFYLSAKRADLLLTISEYSKSSIEKHFGIKNEQINLVAVGILEKYLNNNQNIALLKKLNTPYILYVSRIEPRKNHLLLAQAFVELKLYENYDLIFIGKPSILSRELEKYLDNLPKSVVEKIIRIENVSEDELINYYKNAELFVFPSFAEGFGIPPIEALALGTKVICSNATALGDYDFLKNYQFTPNDIISLKKLILSTLKDNNYPFENFIEVIRNRYSWSVISKILHDAIINTN